MREIKFRAWNTSAGRYSKPFTLKCNVLNYTDDDGIGVVKSLTNEIVEQFTGVVDKNGARVFEGDKIRYMELYECHSDAVDYFDVEPQCNFPVNEVYTENKEGVVVWNNGCFSVNDIYLNNIVDYKRVWDVITENHNYGGLDLDLLDWVREDKGDYKGKYKDMISSIEVIGNIHEQEEL